VRRAYRSGRSEPIDQGLYPTSVAYVGATAQLVDERPLLRDDAAEVIAASEAGTLARHAP
jgi:hypothetical protein